MDDVEWSLTSHGSKAGVDMKRVPVPTQAVQSSLEPQDNHLNSAINPEPFTPEQEPSQRFLNKGTQNVKRSSLQIDALVSYLNSWRESPPHMFCCITLCY